jgi:hypothetical protein
MSMNSLMAKKSVMLMMTWMTTTSVKSFMPLLKKTLQISLLPHVQIQISQKLRILADPDPEHCTHCMYKQCRNILYQKQAYGNQIRVRRTFSAW